MDRRHFLQGSAALGGSLPTAVDRSALAAPVHIDVPARCRGARKSISGLGSNTLKHKILACLLTLSAIAAGRRRPRRPPRTTPRLSPLPTKATRIASSTPAARRRSGLAFIGAKPGMSILDIFAVYG